MHKLILFLLIFVTITSCGSGLTEIEEEQLELSESLEDKFKDISELVYSGDTLIASKDVLSYYDEADYVPIWIRKDSLSDAGNEMIELVDNAMDYGMFPAMFNQTDIHRNLDSSLLDVEMLLSNAFFLYISHINLGYLDTNGYYVWKKDSLSFDITEELERIRNGESAKDVITEKQPTYWEYQQLQKGLANFLDLYPLDTNHYKIPAFKDDSVICYQEAKKALLGHSFLDSADAETDSIFLEKLKVFQTYNGLADDAIVGKWTGKALELSNLDRFYHASVTMNRWRIRDSFPDKYIRVNIPEFTLYYYNDGALVRKHRVVVGAQITPTPEFHATMERMVTNPFWSVPFSIASTEILYGARKDTAYFSKRGYKVFKGNETVDPKSVDWSKVGQGTFGGYRVRQDGGSGNSLGRIKFLFPNVHAVFIHDTPSKSLFMNDVRAYSHGCIRLHQPYELAKELLRNEQNAFQADSLESYINRGIQRTIELKEPFEVFIEYYTTTADSSGNIRFHPDIYGRDKKYIKNTLSKFKP